MENNEYPEQLEDDDFEKEQAEKKRLKKEKKANKKIKKSKESFEIEDDSEVGISADESGILDEDAHDRRNKKSKKIVPIIIFIIVALIVAAIAIYIVKGKDGFSSSNTPEVAIDNFCAYFNSENMLKAIDYIDFKGYYIMYSSLETEDYTKFDSVYASFDESLEDYQNYLEYIEECKEIDSDVYSTILEDVKVSLENVQSVTRIQNTDSLYLIKADLKISSGSDSETVTESIYVDMVDGEYKIVYGYLTDVMLSLFQSVYYYNNYYSY
jgi:hypothetical protein